MSNCIQLPMAARRSCALLVATICGLAAFLQCNHSQGAIVLTGNIEVIAPPPSVVVHVLESDTLARVFVERQSFVLPVNLTVDFIAAGTYDGVGDLPATEPVIAAGTVVDSYFIHADNISSQGLREYEGSITFDVEILGVVLTNLAATRLLSTADGIVGHPGTTYPAVTDGARDVELGPGLNSGDQLILSADRKTLTFHLATEQSADQLRILTAPSTSAVPEPASHLLLLGLVFAIGAHSWRRMAGPSKA